METNVFAEIGNEFLLLFPRFIIVPVGLKLLPPVLVTNPEPNLSLAAQTNGSCAERRRTGRGIFDHRYTDILRSWVEGTLRQREPNLVTILAGNDSERIGLLRFFLRNQRILAGPRCGIVEGLGERNLYILIIHTGNQVFDFGRVYLIAWEERIGTGFGWERNLHVLIIHTGDQILRRSSLEFRIRNDRILARGRRIGDPHLVTVCTSRKSQVCNILHILLGNFRQSTDRRMGLNDQRIVLRTLAADELDILAFDVERRKRIEPFNGYFESCGIDTENGAGELDTLQHLLCELGKRNGPLNTTRTGVVGNGNLQQLAEVLDIVQRHRLELAERKALERQPLSDLTGEDPECLVLLIVGKGELIRFRCTIRNTVGQRYTAYIDCLTYLW